MADSHILDVRGAMDFGSGERVAGALVSMTMLLTSAPLRKVWMPRLRSAVGPVMVAPRLLRSIEAGRKSLPTPLTHFLHREADFECDLEIADFPTFYVSTGLRYLKPP